MRAARPAELEAELKAWTRDEDVVIWQRWSELGPDLRKRSCFTSSWWADTARRLPGRTYHSIHARWSVLQQDAAHGYDTNARGPPPPPVHWPTDTELLRNSFNGGLNGGDMATMLGWQPVWVVSMVVPANWRPGRKLATTLKGGVRVIITPPDDATPGMPIKCQVPVPASEIQGGERSSTPSLSPGAAPIYLREAVEAKPGPSSSNWGAERFWPAESRKSHLKNSAQSIKPSVRWRVRPQPGTLVQERPAGAFDPVERGAVGRAIAATGKSEEAAFLGRNSKLAALAAMAVAKDRGANGGALCGSSRHVQRLLLARPCPTCDLAQPYSQHSFPSVCTGCLRALQPLVHAVPGKHPPRLKPRVVRDQIAPALAAAAIAAWKVEADADEAPEAKKQRSEASPGTVGGLLRGKHRKPREAGSVGMAT